MNLKLKVWRQKNRNSEGRLVDIAANGIPAEASFLEMLDIVNERLNSEGAQPIAFDHDCREGICGTCSLMVDGQAHGPQKGTAVCQLHMRKFHDGQTIVVDGGLIL